MRKVLCIAIFCLLAAAGNDARAGCHINVGVKNTGDSDIKVFSSSRVKSRGGSWRRLQNGMWAASYDGSFVLAPGESYSDGYIATFGCGKKRRYRFTIQCRNAQTNRWAEQYFYYPSANGWTENQTFTKNISCL